MSKCTNRMTTFKKNRPKTSRCSRFPAFQLQEQQKVLAVPPRLLLEIEVLSTSPAGYTSGRWKWNPLNQLWTKHKPTENANRNCLCISICIWSLSNQPTKKKDFVSRHPNQCNETNHQPSRCGKRQPPGASRGFPNNHIVIHRNFRTKLLDLDTFPEK